MKVTEEESAMLYSYVMASQAMITMSDANKVLQIVRKLTLPEPPEPEQKEIKAKKAR